MNLIVKTLFSDKIKVMKHSKFIIAILSAIFLIPLTSNAQEEIIVRKAHRPHHAELLIINNDLPHDSSLVIIFEENAPERFNAPKTPSFAFMSFSAKIQNMF